MENKDEKRGRDQKTERLNQIETEKKDGDRRVETEIEMENEPK